MPENVLWRLWSVLPLHSLAKHACVAKHWKTEYEKRLHIEQQRLRALVATPSEVPRAQTLSPEELLRFKRALPVYEARAGVRQGKATIMVSGAWRKAPTASGFARYQLPFVDINDTFRLEDTTLGTRIDISWRTPHHMTLDLRVHASVKSVEGLQVLIGLLLELVQELLPLRCGEQRSRFGPYFHFSKVECRLPFSTGWSTWAPLALLMGNMMFARTVAAPNRKGSASMQGSSGSNTVLHVQQWMSLLQARNPQARPLQVVRVFGPTWERSGR